MKARALKQTWEIPLPAKGTAEVVRVRAVTEGRLIRHRLMCRTLQNISKSRSRCVLLNWQEWHTQCSLVTISQHLNHT